jgi:hypothetical protein
MSDNYFADALSKTDDKIQASFFNAFFRGLNVGSRDADNQLYYIAGNLDKSTIDMMKLMVDYGEKHFETRAEHTADISALYSKKRDLEIEIEALQKQKAELDA